MGDGAFSSVPGQTNLSKMDRTRVIIVMAMSRVGSTFLRRILADHKDVYITNETRLYTPRPWTSYFHAAMVRVDRYPLPKEEALAALDAAYWSVEYKFPDVTRRHRSPDASAMCVRAVEDALLPGYQVVGDKGYTPGVLKGKFFEEFARQLSLKIIFIYRDPRDTFTSIGRNKTDYPYNVLWAEDPRRHSIQWIGNMRSWFAIRGKFPYLEVKYERLMSEPRPVLREVQGFLELKSAGPLVGSFKNHVAKRDHLGYWRDLYPDMERELHPDIFPIMEELGYAREA